MIDHALVALVLCCAFGYATLALGPRTWKVGALRTLSGVLSRLPLRWLQSVGQRLSAAGGKGGCGSCGSCTADVPPATTSPGEVRIAPSAIGRRVHRY